MKKKIKKKTSLKKKKNSPFFFSQTRYILIGVTTLALFLFGFLLLKADNTSSEKCANSISCINNLSGVYDEENEGLFEGKKVAGPPLAYKPYAHSFTEDITQATVLGESSADSKRIYIDLTNQKLYAYENSNLLYEFKVSTGKPWWPTPTGDFRVWIKLKYTRMTGGSGSGYYDLPNVPYTMFFYNDKVPKYKGYGIHGAYWHENFGFPMSHGCINMDEPDAEKLYNWATPVSDKNSVKATDENPGTLITIYGETPLQ